MSFKTFIFVWVGLCLVEGVVGAKEVQPNDPYYSYQTAFKNSSSSHGSIVDTWGLQTDASHVIIAVIDSGVDLTHPDLIDNFWVNRKEIPGNGIDDDGNGYIDDVHGYDFKNKDGNPEDETGHGSLTAGIIGDVGDNGIGSAGVAWSVQLMILKVFGSSGGGTADNLAAAIDYAVTNGAQIINASWTTQPTFKGDEIDILKEAVARAQEAGVLVVAAAGNEATNIDEEPVFPASYSFDNIISVAALEKDSSRLLSHSNFGKNSVSVAAIGDELVGAYLKGGYATLTGTSAATAVVSGVSALMLATNSSLKPKEIRDILMTTSDPLRVLTGLVASSGSLNAYESIAQSKIPKTLSVQSTSQGTPAGTGAPVSETGTSSEKSSGSSAGGCSLIP